MMPNIYDLVHDYKLNFNSWTWSQNSTSFLLRLLKIPHEVEYRPKNQSTRRKSRFDIIVWLWNKRYIIIENKFRGKKKNKDRAANQLTRYSEFWFPVMAIHNKNSMCKWINLILEMMETSEIYDSRRWLINMFDHRGRIRSDQLIR